MKEAVIEALNVGLPAPLDHAGTTVPSGFVKRPVLEPVFLSKEGLEGDEQADKKNHGGVDKAVCVYPLDRYPYWNARLGRVLGGASFGENVSLSGLTEDEVCIGDVFRVGEATVQVSQPRGPCFKLAAHNKVPKLPLWLQETGYTGWYLRVLQEGLVQVGDRFIFVSRSAEPVSVREANRVKYFGIDDAAAVARVMRQEAVSDSWRRSMLKRINAAKEKAAKAL